MSEDSLGKALILTATERQVDAIDWFDRFDVHTWRQVEQFVYAMVLDPSSKRILLGEVAKYQATSVRPCEIPDFKVELEIATAASFADVDRMSGVSGVGSMVVYPDHGLPPYSVVNPEILIANLGYGIVNGNPRSGKTNFTIELIRVLAEADVVVFSNIRPTPKADWWTYVRKTDDLWRGLAALEYGQPWTLILDEAGLYWQKSTASERRSKELDRLARVVAKLFGGLVLIEQRPESVPSTIQAFATSTFFAHAPGIVTIDLRGPKLAYRIKVAKFPDMGAYFDSHDVAHLDVAPNVDRLLEALSAADGDPQGVLRAFVERELYDRTCAHCGGPIRAGARADAIYCSTRCRQAANA